MYSSYTYQNWRLEQEENLQESSTVRFTYYDNIKLADENHSFSSGVPNLFDIPHP